MPTPEPRTAFLVLSADDESLLRLGLWVLTASSVGEQVDVLLCAPALCRLADGSFDAVRSSGTAAGREALGLPAPSALLSQAKELSSVRVVTCETELALAGLQTVPPGLDGLVSLPTFWRETAAARLVRL